ncbi:cleavage and polyadenylylation specificity factor [Striga asiatica]|uniref:Cleavage and polyadenylylation specificity factor n=1 Tax=Striga asiatica TaxID=4170 RepID=A0A5A7PX62_STRAF|nr:cleavage and polyadenylylation specificity factor [Striga asiatica]
MDPFVEEMTVREFEERASSSIANPPTAPAVPCLSQQYGVPFHVVSAQEVEDYKRLLSKPLTAPRDLDWGILDDLLISEDVKRYLELLGLTVFENIALETFPKLTLEFFSTVAMHDNGKGNFQFQSVSHTISGPGMWPSIQC